MRFCYPKSARIRTRRHYQRITQQSKRLIGNWIIIDVRKCSGPSTKLGVTVSKRYGNAVARNRFKRIVREAFRLSFPQLPQGIDLNIKPRSAACEAKSFDILPEIVELLKNVH